MESCTLEKQVPMRVELQAADGTKEDTELFAQVSDNTAFRRERRTPPSR